MTGFVFPEILLKVFNLFTSGQEETAQAYFFKHLPLIGFEFQFGVGGFGKKRSCHGAQLKAPICAHLPHHSI